MSDPDLSTLSVRPTIADDCARLETFIAPFVEQGRILPRTTEELQGLMQHGYLAEVDGEIVGFAALEVYSAKMGEIRSLSVAEPFRGKGVGRALVEACLGRARERNVFEVMVITSEDGFFQRCGFDYTLPGEKRALFYQTREKP